MQASPSRCSQRQEQDGSWVTRFPGRTHPVPQISYESKIQTFGPWINKEVALFGGQHLTTNNVFMTLCHGFLPTSCHEAYVLPPRFSLIWTPQPFTGRRAYHPCASHAYSIGPMTSRISTTAPPSPPSPPSTPKRKGPTHIILPAEVAHSARDHDHVHERDPGGPLRPAEVLVPVLDHVCRPRGQLVVRCSRLSTSPWGRSARSWFHGIMGERAVGRTPELDHGRVLGQLCVARDMVSFWLLASQLREGGAAGDAHCNVRGLPS